MQSTTEIWKDIPGYEGLYQISNLGRIGSTCPNPQHPKSNQFRILKLSACTNKYLKVTLCKDRIKKQIMVHRLVAQSFIANPDNKRCVNHKDSNRTNNNVYNLEWVTHSENTDHAYDTGFLSKNKRKVEQLTKSGDFIRSWDSVVDAIKSGIPVSVYGCLGGQKHTAGGYRWKYATEI